MAIPAYLRLSTQAKKSANTSRPDANVSPVLTGSLPTRAFISALFLAVAALGSLSATSCSDDTGGGGSGTGGAACGLDADSCFDYSCYQQGQARSFATDVLPIFENSCALSTSCHGDPSSPDPASGYRPYLGAVDPPSDIDLIFSTVVGQDSHNVAGMKMIDPGKPETSFLMHKMDNDLTCAALTCKDGDCGTEMPQGSDPLPAETRNTVRDWILQGAANN